jgi:uncharacterized Fe-S center protein
MITYNSRMHENDTNKWNVGLKFVQLMKNHACCLCIKRVPNEAMFGTTLEVDISTTSCLKMW